jgi:hypothetical protein
MSDAWTACEMLGRKFMAHDGRIDAACVGYGIRGVKGQKTVPL